MLILNYVTQLEHIQIDSILDLGLSKQTHRDKFIAFAKENDFKIKLHYLDISKKIRFKRVLKRNQEKGVTYEFMVSKEIFDFMETWFEKPTKTELKNAIIIK